MLELNDIIEFYKNGKISDTSFEFEIGRTLDPILNITVSLDKTTSQSNSSYVLMLVPENVNGFMRTTLVIDKNMIKERIPTDQIIALIDATVTSVLKCGNIYNAFILSKKDSEVSYNECIKLYLDIYNKQMESLYNLPIIVDLIKNRTISTDKIADISLAIENGTEKTDSILEYIKTFNILPEFVLGKVNELFNDLNKANGITPTIKEVDGTITTPTNNYYFNQAKELTNGIIPPYAHNELESDYTPKSNK